MSNIEKYRKLHHPGMKEIDIQTSVTTMKVVLSFLPFGAVVKEFIFGTESDLQQKRIANLLEELSIRLAKLDASSVKQDYLMSEEFHDHFIVASTVAKRTRNEKKIRRLVDILINQITEAVIDEHVDVYMNMVGSIEEIELLVLKMYSEANEGIEYLYIESKLAKDEWVKNKDRLLKEAKLQEQGYANNYSLVEKNIAESLQKMKTVNDEIYNRKNKIKPELLQISESQLEYYKYSLVAKGLVKERPAVASDNILGFDHVYIVTEYGKSFLKFLLKASE